MGTSISDSTSYQITSIIVIRRWRLFEGLGRVRQSTVRKRFQQHWSDSYVRAADNRTRSCCSAADTFSGVVQRVRSTQQKLQLQQQRRRRRVNLVQVSRRRRHVQKTQTGNVPLLSEIALVA